MDAKVEALVEATLVLIKDLKEWTEDYGEAAEEDYGSYYVAGTKSFIEDAQTAIDDLTTKECPTCNGKGTVKGDV